MLLSLRSDHKEHLAILTTLSNQVLVDFCKLAIDYLQNGINLKLYSTAAQKLQAEVVVIKNAINGLINLLLESCKYKLNEADFRDSVLSVGFSQESQLVLSKFYESQKSEINNILSHYVTNVPHYFDLEWRFEVEVSSRCLLQQVNPLITMNLCLQTQPDIKHSECDGPKTNICLQTDPTNLVHMTQVLEQALKESRSRQVRRIQKAFQ